MSKKLLSKIIVTLAVFTGLSMFYMLQAVAAGPTIAGISASSTTGSVSFKVTDAALAGKEVSVVCYNPAWKGTADLNSSQANVVYLNQYTVNTSQEIKFTIKDAKPTQGEYTLVVGSEIGKATVKINFYQVELEKELKDLDTTITKAKDYEKNKSQYTPESYKKLTDALTAANAAKSKLDPAEVKKANTELQNAIDNLVTVSIKLLPPKGIKAAQSGAKIVALTWNKVPNAKSYTIFRSAKATSGFTKIGSATSTTYADRTVKAGKTYYYRVQTIGATAASNSDQSASVSAKLLGAPKLSKATRTGTKAKVTWKKVTGAKGYYVYSAKKKNGPYRKKVATVTKGSKITVTTKKLAKGKNYIKVAAYVKVNGKTVVGALSSKAKLVTIK